MKNTLFPYSVLLNIILLLLLGIAVLMHRQEPCSDSPLIKTKVDTIYPTSTKPVLVKSYTPVVKRSGYKHVDDEGELSQSVPSNPEIAGCYDSINYYSDTFYQSNNYRAVVNDTIANNRIAGRSFWFVNLKPDVITTIEKVRKEKIRVYVGADFTVNANYRNSWGIGPSAIVTLPPRFALSYYYDARNNAHTGGLFVLLKFSRSSQ